MSEQHNLFQDTHSGESAQYLVNSRHEIAMILSALMSKNEIVTGYFDQGKIFFLSAILEVNAESGQLVLDCGPDADINRRALASSRFIFVSNQNRIKIQFKTPALELVDFNGYPAFRTQFPTSLLRLQRRQYYRLVAPIRAPLFCKVPDLAGEAVELKVANISVGGVAVSDFPEPVELEKGLLFTDCRIALPEEGTIEATLEVRNIQQIDRRSGQPLLRAGCRFVGISKPHQAMIQRYIIHTDLERRALL